MKLTTFAVTVHVAGVADETTGTSPDVARAVGLYVDPFTCADDGAVDVTVIVFGRYT